MNKLVSPVQRIISLVMYSIALLVVQKYFFDKSLLPGDQSLWLYSGLFAVLISSRLTNPYFTPPLDALLNAFAAFTAIAACLTSTALIQQSHVIIYTTLFFYGFVFVIAFVAMVAKNLWPQSQNKYLAYNDRLAQKLGNASILFTVVIVTSVWLFHYSSTFEVYTILCIWPLIAFVHPIEEAFAFVTWARNQTRNKKLDYYGTVVAYQIPNLALIKIHRNYKFTPRQILKIIDQEGTPILGLTLSKVGKDDGVLVKVLTMSLPANLRDNLPVVPENLVNVAYAVTPAIEDIENIDSSEEADYLKKSSFVCGMVDQDTSPSILQFEVTEDKNLAEGCLVETKVFNESVLYQVVDGLTKEDIVQQKDKYGYVRARARKIGKWNKANKKFDLVSWMPRINSPVFLREHEVGIADPLSVGMFPQTDYGIRIDISQAVTHNTAILGILGVGKSFLAFELIERMLKDDIRVICLDLTDQYKDELTQLIDKEYIQQKFKAINPSEKGTCNSDRNSGGNKLKFLEKIKAELEEFMRNNKNKILVFNPAEFKVWKQTQNLYNGDAPLEPFSVTEVAAYFSIQALAVCQELGKVDRARLCIVYEEAHSLVPEWNSVVNEGDKLATASAARAILQGRKYGLGCLLITQRTANVTKTILNQCNTIFAMRTFDDTGKEFLANYIGSDYASSLASLKAQHAVFYGKASSCENPILIKLNNRTDFISAFRTTDKDQMEANATQS